MEDVTVDSLEADGNMRWLWTAGNENIEAGTRDKNLTVRVIKNVPKDDPYKYVIEKLNQKGK
jgi:hypothetical protein